MNETTRITIPRGFRAAGVKAGIKPSGGLDLALLAADGPCAAVGTFTTNRVCAAPVRWCRELLPRDDIRAIVINAGNANAATGAEGQRNAARTAAAAGALMSCLPEQVLVASTGVIGHQLPMDRLEEGLSRAHTQLSSARESFETAADAILTTDTRRKVISLHETAGDQPYSLLGMAKGAAMIGPRMATMLAFLLTDAPVWANDLGDILLGAVENSFNCVSVEGHTSTNDTVLLLAGGGSGAPRLTGSALGDFASVVKRACTTLARMIPDDGEGSTHLITIDVEGCRDREQARAIARAVADSVLVKTAIHGADPNWGRIVSAAGYSGVDFEESQLSLWLDGVALYQAGTPLDFDAPAVSKRLRENREIHIRLVFTLGSAAIRFWTCDLTAEYIHLNADYTT
jgi:glutamate N-acetyltransferase / amino-acid N-acetyltransferase